MKSSGVPSQADQWWWGFTFYRRPSLDGDVSGTEDCKAKFKIAWTRIKLPKGTVRLLSAWSKRLLEIENIRDQVVGLRVRDDQIRHLLVI